MFSNLHLINLSQKNHDILAANVKLRRHDIHKPAFWFAVVGLCFNLIGFTIKLYSVFNDADTNIAVSIYSDFVAKLWFGVFHFFTQQTSFLIIVCYILFFTALRTRMFNRRDFIIVCATYISVVMCVYWVVIIPTSVLKGSFSTNPYELSQTLFFHLFCPVIFDFFAVLSVNYPYSFKNPASRINDNKLWLLVGISVAVYSCYAVAINNVQLPANIFKESYCPPEGHRYISVYGPITNFNSNCYNLVYDIAGEPYFDENSTGTVFNMLIGFPLALILFGFATGFVYMNNRLCTPAELNKKIQLARLDEIDKENEIFMQFASQAKKQISSSNKTNQ